MKQAERTITSLDSWFQSVYVMDMTMIAEIGTGQLAELVKQVQAGNEVLLTQGNKPVAKLVPALDQNAVPPAVLKVRSFKGHRVLTPVISQSELAAELFSRQ